MFGVATAAILPPAIATSRTALDPALRVDDVPALEQQVVPGLGHGASADEQERCDGDEQARAHGSGPPGGVALRGEARVEVLAHVTSPVISSPLTRPVNVKLRESPCSQELRTRTASPSIVPRRSRDTKSPWCDAVEHVAPLPHVKRWSKTLAAYSIRTSQVPGRSTSGAALAFSSAARRLRQDGEQPLGHDLLVARRHHVRADREPRLVRSRAFRAPGRARCAASLSNRSFATASPVVPSSARSQRIWSSGIRFDSPSAGVTELVTPAIGSTRCAMCRARRSTSGSRRRGRASSTPRRPPASPSPLPCRP